MANLTIEKLRSVNWDLGNLWDVKFPFLELNGFTPAVDVEMNLGGINQTTYGNINYQGLGYRTQPTLSLTVFDDENNTLFTKLKEWYDEISPYTMEYVYAIDDAKKTIILNKLDKSKNVVKTYTLEVVPQGDLSYHGTSDGTPNPITLSFLIVNIK